MNILKELKMVFRAFLVPFYKSEIIEAYGAFYEIKRNLSNNISTKEAWQEISDNIERILVLNPNYFIATIEKNNNTPREAMYFWCYNNANSALEATDYIFTRRRIGLQISMEFLSKEIAKIKGR